MKKGLLVVLSGPSGTGKGTLIEQLKKNNGNIRLSVSATTRKPRQNEIDGRNYFFKTEDEFKKMIEEDRFIEWVQYCGNYYGTPREFVEQSLNEGYDVIFELEVEGAVEIKKKYPQSILIFVVPPSFDELEKRIRERGTEDPEAIKKRMERAVEEFKYISHYDYIVVNKVAKTAAKTIEKIIISEKQKTIRNVELINDITSNWNNARRSST